MIRSRQKALAVDPLEFLPCVPKLGGTRTFGSADSVQDNGDGYFPLGLGSFGGCRENCIKLKVHLTFKPPSTSLPFAFLPYHSPNQRVVNLDPFTFSHRSSWLLQVLLDPCLPTNLSLLSTLPSLAARLPRYTSPSPTLSATAHSQ